ncbi:hypothetical protein [Collimonas sp.]|jgi:hypothetical protein|uniref:hypothetical protein n=1 Tax=Collimonas sp. TaxID=1963772 RepID=UPI002C36A6DF|nr:hypothetical protein [Collimonas sp.]HWW03655.1 hypothetical protein [Collimonas sp.]
MNLDFKEQDSMYSKPLRNTCTTFFRYSNAFAVKRLLALPLLLLLLSLAIGCLASR